MSFNLKIRSISRFLSSGQILSLTGDQRTEYTLFRGLTLMVAALRISTDHSPTAPPHPPANDRMIPPWYTLPCRPSSAGPSLQRCLDNAFPEQLVTVTSRIGDSAPLGVSAFVREANNARSASQCNTSSRLPHHNIRNGAIIRDGDHDSDSGEFSPCIVAMAMASSPTT
ncbi:hypothetical protein BGY98DRAFT_462106 [Russula aff. rugulosa BPL654]|nr:hypothetical protein BGY98DRAFT_462106 [Russula aff. rugulosa BPL654]